MQPPPPPSPPLPEEPLAIADPSAICDFTPFSVERHPILRDRQPLVECGGSERCISRPISQRFCATSHTVKFYCLRRRTKSLRNGPLDCTMDMPWEKELGGIVTLGFSLGGGLLPPLNYGLSRLSCHCRNMRDARARVFWRMSLSRAFPSNVVVNK